MKLLTSKTQDRKKWYFPLVQLGNDAMNKAVETEIYTSYHYEAAIAVEHLKAKDFAATDWNKILNWYEKLYKLQPSSFNLLNLAMVQLQRADYQAALQLLQQINPKDLEQRAYLYYGSYSEYFVLTGKGKKALAHIDTALQLVRNEAERQFLLKKKYSIASNLN